jgi:hypothetical protein
MSHHFGETVVHDSMKQERQASIYVVMWAGVVIDA